MTNNTVRTHALEYLRRDFQDRCAYSMQHAHKANGIKSMEIDHFNPRLREPQRNEYKNLFLATRHCNGSKGNKWPMSAETKLGIYPLNCCSEMEYGVHIFENEDDHSLIGVTASGKYHIRLYDLNAPHLINERKERAKYRILLERTPFTLKRDADDSEYLTALETFKHGVELLIPPIAYLPTESSASLGVDAIGTSLLTPASIQSGQKAEASSAYSRRKSFWKSFRGFIFSILVRFRFR